MLNFFPHAEGYVNVTYCPVCETGAQTRFNYVYQYKDHLGNIRLSYGYDQKDEVLKIIEENHYYPFGLKHTKYNSGKNKYEPDEEEPDKMKLKAIPAGEAVMNKYKYNGKEWQDELELNMYAMDLRQYDPAIGRFVCNDPVEHHYQSTYTAFDNNPVFYADPIGADSTDSFGRLTSENGRYISATDRGDFGDAAESQIDEKTEKNDSDGNGDGKKKTKAVGGVVDGRNLEDLNGTHSSGIIFQETINGTYIEPNDVDAFIKKEITNLMKGKEILSIFSKTSFGISLVAPNAKINTTIDIILNGKNIKVPLMAVLGFLMSKGSSKLSTDQLTLSQMATSYYKQENRNGIYYIKSHTGNMLLPGSDKVTHELYDAKSGKSYGTISSGALLGFN